MHTAIFYSDRAYVVKDDRKTTKSIFKALIKNICNGQSICTDDKRSCGGGSMACVAAEHDDRL